VTTASADPSDRFLIAGVMGFPVMHSRSPALHNYWFKKHRLAGTYLPLAIKPERLAAALRALPALGFSGCNLTIPHKEKAVAFVDEVDEAARRIGAISCVTVRPDGSLLGANYDGYGFIQSILDDAPGWRADAGPAVVVGAGGAARAVAFSLIEQGVPEIQLINRTLSRAQSLAEEFGQPLKAVTWEARRAALDGAALLVNTTSQGMIGEPALDLPLETLPASALVADIVYIPRETPLLGEARRHGNRTINGLGMLLHQARPAWKSWFGIEPQVTTELRALIEATL
jgi:shikimate dehydrogenase